MACMYAIDGKQYSLPEFKAYLADGGIDALYPEGNYPWLENKKPASANEDEAGRVADSVAESLLDQHAAIDKRITEGKITADEMRAEFEKLASNGEAIMAELSKFTKAELDKRIRSYIRPDAKKADLVEDAYEAMITDYWIGDGLFSYSVSFGSKETAAQAKTKKVRQFLSTLTDESIQKHADDIRQAQQKLEEERKAAVAGMENPKTLNDYYRLLKAKIADGMTYDQSRMSLSPEQRATMDEMAAEQSRDERKARADQQKTDVRATTTTTSGDIIETKHTKTGEDLFVVKAADRVETDIFSQWKATAKQIGGWYSTYRGAGAVPGFQFKTRENAEAFIEYLGGDVTQAKEAIQERRDAYADDKSQTAVERLNEMADRLEDRGNESLNQNRKANTARRAGMAANAIRAAELDIAQAKTMRNIAKAIGDGAAKFLDRVRQKTQVEMLQSFVNVAQGDKIRAQYDNYGEQERHKGEKPDGETADYAKYPDYTAFRSDLASLARGLVEHDGTKKIGQDLLKVADDVDQAYLKWAKENLSKVNITRTSDGMPSAFKSKSDAEEGIRRANYKGKAIVLPVKRGENVVILSPSEAMKRGIWKGDNDKRITLSKEFGKELVEKIGKAARRNKQLSVPWQFEYAYDKQKRLSAMGIETKAEFRAALREFISLSEAPKAVDKIKEMERAMIGRANDGLDFFPTPASVAEQMVETADIRHGMAILEPSAGMGHIAERIREAGVEPDVVELSNGRKELLEAKGFSVVGRDFTEFENPSSDVTLADLESARDIARGEARDIMDGAIRSFNDGDNGGALLLIKKAIQNTFSSDFGAAIRPILVRMQGGYDRIVMNPPFGDRRDAAHVMHAYDLLKPGGRLVTIMGEGVFFGQDKKAQAFRDWLEERGGTDEKLEDGTFNDPSLPVTTGVAARLVVIDKPEGETSGIKFSKGQSTGSTVAEVESWLPKRVKSMLDAGKLKVVQSVEDLPEHLQERGTALYHAAWHGGPHDHNKFDSNKIGTGEGSQAFGHGLYFTDSKDIAEWYKKTLSGDKNFSFGAYTKLTREEVQGIVSIRFGDDFLDNVTRPAGVADRVMDDLISGNDNPYKKGSERHEMYNELKSRISHDGNAGRLYQVELAPEADEYLDWGKPLSEQSEKVKEAIFGSEYEIKFSDKAKDFGFNPLSDGMTGKDFYSQVTKDKLKGPKAASDYLHSLGIRGIRYKAEGGKSDANNYVIFSDEDVSITAKYSKLSGVEGLYDNKRDELYLVADMLDKGNLSAVLSHELYHRGLATDEKLKAAVDRFEAQMQRSFDHAAKGRGSKAEQEAYARVIAAETPAKDQLEEYQAYLVSSHERNPDSLSGMVRKAIADFVAAIRAFLIRNGLDMGFIKSLTPADLAAMSRYGAKTNNKQTDNFSFGDETKIGVMASTKPIPETININGKDRPTRNSNGQLIHQTEEGIRNFYEWFGESKVVDEQGRPLVVYHGTDADFDEFDTDQSSRHGKGAWFTSDKDSASSWAKLSYKGVGAYQVVPVYLRANDPLEKTGGLKFTEKEIEKGFISKLLGRGSHDSVIQRKPDGSIGNAVVRSPNQIKSATGNTGDFNPENPDIRYSMAWAEKVAPTIAQNIADHLSTTETFNWWNRTVGSQFHKALKDKKYFGPVFNKSMQFEQDVAKFANENADMAPDILPKLGENPLNIPGEIKAGYQRTNNLKGVGKAIFDTTLRDMPMTEDELSQEGLNDSQKAMYRQFFKAVNASLDDVAKSEMFRIARSLKLIPAPQGMTLEQSAQWYADQDEGNAKLFTDKAEAIKKLKTEGYAPLMRFGQYTVTVTGEQGDTEFFGMFETQAEANKIERAMIEEYPDSTVTKGMMSQEDWKLFRGVTPESMEVFAKLMNVGQDEAFQAYLKTAVNNRSALKRLIHRKKIKGFDMDVSRVLATFITSNSRMSAKNYHMGEMLDAIAAIPKEKGDVRDEAVSLYEFVQNPQTKGAAVRNLLFTWYLGGSVASAMVNLTQTITTTLPFLHQFGSTKDVAAALHKAMRQAVNYKSITGELGDALKRAEEEGVTAPHELHMLYGESMRNDMFAPEWLRPLGKAWGSLFSAAEAYNRRVAFIAAYQLAKANNHGDPFAFAEDAVNQTQFVYSKSSRPNWSRSTIGSVLFTFKQFSVNYLEFLSRLPRQERAIALGILVLLAGAGGAPGADDLDDVMDTIGQSLGYNTNAKAWKDKVANDLLGDAWGKFAMNGISAFAPFDVAGRLSVGNIIPGTAILKKSETDKSRDVLEFFGAAGSLAKRAVQAFDDASAREGGLQFAGNFAGALMPKAMQDAYKAADMLQTGQYRDGRGRKVADTDAKDALWKLLGLQPTNVSDKRHAEWMVNQQITLTKAVESDIADLWAQGRYENNNDKVVEAKSLLMKWNNKNPETPIKIDMSQITKRLKQMRLTSRERLIKTAPREMRKYVKQYLSDTNDESISGD